jgi:hypothetical protein
MPKPNKAGIRHIKEPFKGSGFRVLSTLEAISHWEMDKEENVRSSKYTKKQMQQI